MARTDKDSQGCSGRPISEGNRSVRVHDAVLQASSARVALHAPVARVASLPEGRWWIFHAA
jgi:hypothetical protein